MRRPSLLALLFLLAACGGSSTGPDDGGGGGGGGGGTDRLTATIDGQAFTATTVQANPVSVVPGSLNFLGFQTAGGVTRSIAISLAYITGPGTYPFGTNIGTTPGGVASHLSGAAVWTTPLSGTAGSITITSISATRVVGTFTFTATPVGGTAANLVVTNGSFNVPRSTGYVVPSGDDIGSTVTATVNGTPRVLGTVVGVGGGTETRILGGQDLEYSFSITVGPATSIGSGPLTGATVPLRRVTVQRVGTAQSWGGTGNDQGTLAITAITPTRIAGTFNGTLGSNAGTQGSLTVTNGTFSVRTPQ